MLRVERGLGPDRGQTPPGSELGPGGAGGLGQNGALEACGRQEGAGLLRAGEDVKSRVICSHRPQVRGRVPGAPRSARWESHQAGPGEPGQAGGEGAGAPRDTATGTHQPQMCTHCHMHTYKEHRDALTDTHRHSPTLRNTIVYTDTPPPPRSPAYSAVTAADVCAPSHVHTPPMCTDRLTLTHSHSSSGCRGSWHTHTLALAICPPSPAVSRPWPGLP